MQFKQLMLTIDPDDEEDEDNQNKPVGTPAPAEGQVATQNGPVQGNPDEVTDPAVPVQNTAGVLTESGQQPPAPVPEKVKSRFRG